MNDQMSAIKGIGISASKQPVEGADKYQNDEKFFAGIIFQFFGEGWGGLSALRPLICAAGNGYLEN